MSFKDKKAPISVLAALLGSGNVGSVTFTAADKRKLNGIEAGAQVNPKNIIRVSMEDGNATNLVAGLAGFYKTGLPVNSGDDMNEVDVIYLPYTGATFGADAIGIDTDLTAVNLRPYFNDRLQNGGAVVLAIELRGSSNFTYVQAERVATHSGGWSLSQLTWYGSQSITTQGRSWNIVAGNDLHFTKDMVDIAAYYAKLDGSNLTSAFIAAVQNPEETVPFAGAFRDKFTRNFVSNVSNNGEAIVSTDNNVPSGAPSTVTAFVALKKQAADGTDQNAALAKIRVGDWLRAKLGDKYIITQIQHVNENLTDDIYEFWFDPSTAIDETLQYDTLGLGTGEIRFYHQIRDVGITYKKFATANLTNSFANVGGTIPAGTEVEVTMRVKNSETRRNWRTIHFNIDDLGTDGNDWFSIWGGAHGQRVSLQRDSTAPYQLQAKQDVVSEGKIWVRIEV